MKIFLENYRFCRKSGNYTYSRGWVGGHVIYVIMTHCIRKSICDSPLMFNEYVYLLIYFETSVDAGTQQRVGANCFTQFYQNIRLSDSLTSSGHLTIFFICLNVFVFYLFLRLLISPHHDEKLSPVLWYDLKLTSNTININYVVSESQQQYLYKKRVKLVSKSFISFTFKQLNLNDNHRDVFRTHANIYTQKQSSRGVIKKKCSENMQQIYRRTPIPKKSLFGMGVLL